MSFKGLKTFKSSDKTCAGDILSRFLVFGRRKSSPLSINISWLKQYFVWIYQPQLLFCDFLYIFFRLDILSLFFQVQSSLFFLFFLSGKIFQTDLIFPVNAF